MTFRYSLTVSLYNWVYSHWFQGWLNEMFEYDPETYHLSLTHSVFATLEGHCLRLDYPRNNISRRATYDEKPPEAVVVSSRCFQLQNGKVCLLGLSTYTHRSKLTISFEEINKTLRCYESMNINKHMYHVPCTMYLYL